MRRMFWLALSLVAAAGAQTITIRAGTLLDGKSSTRKNVRVTIEGTKIARIDSGAGPATYDLSNLTLMPGWIDTHVHVNGHFNRQGRAETRSESPAEFILRTQGAAYQTLMGGFTTVQSMGAETDKELRDLINEGAVVGPRILTSLGSLNER